MIATTDPEIAAPITTSGTPASPQPTNASTRRRTLPPKSAVATSAKTPNAAMTTPGVPGMSQSARRSATTTATVVRAARRRLA